MNSSNTGSASGQPPLTRRQVRDLERAREAGEAITGSISVVSGSPVPSAMPVASPSPAPTSSPARGSASASSSPSSASAPGSIQAPGSAHGPGSAHTPTRRELRAQREAATPTDASPVPLRTPKPEHERNLSDALSHVADIENGRTDTIVPPREAPRTPGSQGASSVTPAGAGPEAAAPSDTARVVSPSAEHDDADDVESSSAESLPTPVSAGRSDESTTAVSSSAGEAVSADASTESVPGPRRRGVSTPSPEGDASVGQRIAAATPPPSSTPTVFPFALASSAPEPTSAPEATPAPAPATPGVGAMPSAAATPSAAAAVAPSAAAPSAPSTPAPSTAAPSAATPSTAASGTPRQQQIPASVPEPTSFVPPTGHWSTQADLDDDAADSVGSNFGSMTSTGQHNAFIIANDQLPDITGALNATGEVIITGSIDLPRSLAATGSHHAQRIDGSDIDRMLEEGDREQPDSDATPVRASRAVSANTSTRAVVLAAGKPKTNRLPIIAGICGGVVILVILGLVIAGFATGVL